MTGNQQKCHCGILLDILKKSQITHKKEGILKVIKQLINIAYKNLKDSHTYFYVSLKHGKIYQPYNIC